MIYTINMVHKEYLSQEIYLELKKRLKGLNSEVEIPPAVFIDMKGRLGKFDKNESSLVCTFPVLAIQLNPFGNMQGGIISVKAVLLKQEGRFLFFEAKLTDPEGHICASAKSRHFIL